MKNKIALAAAFMAATSYSTAEIVINDFLSFEGFVDMSYSQTNTELEDIDESENSFAIDQVEISWLFDFDPVTAQIDLAYEGSDGDQGTVVEQAFATYHMDNGGAITAGRYASMLGFEAFEPTGLYQFSFAYDIHDAGIIEKAINGNNEGSSTSILPGYAQGVKYTYEGENSFFGISLQDEAFAYDGSRLGGDDDVSSFAVEAAGSIAMDNGLSFFLGGAYEAGDGSGGDASDTSADGDTYVINAYTTFETGAWIFAAEINYGESETGRFFLDAPSGIDYNAEDEEVLSGLIMANFAYSEQASITGRISYTDHETDGVDEVEADFLKYTIAHGYAFTDNLFLVTELSYVDGEVDDGASADYESLLAAVELIFSF